MLQRRKQEALARAKGTSRRASGWAGEKAARSGGLIRVIPGQRTRASLEGSSLVTRCGLARDKARPRAKSLS